MVVSVSGLAICNVNFTDLIMFCIERGIGNSNPKHDINVHVFLGN